VRRATITRRQLKRYFRDKRWQVHVERPVQERLLELRKAARELPQWLGREPSGADVLGEEDPGMECALSMEAVSAHWDELPRREQRILLMRFYGDMSQAAIGEVLGISQMHVSRLLAHALGYLHACIPGPSSVAGRAARVS